MKNQEATSSLGEEFVVATTAQIQEVCNRWNEVIKQFPKASPPLISAEHFLRILREITE